MERSSFKLLKDYYFPAQKLLRLNNNYLCKLSNQERFKVIARYVVVVNYNYNGTMIYRECQSEKIWIMYNNYVTNCIMVYES